jgi:hypothetical protein
MASHDKNSTPPAGGKPKPPLHPQGDAAMPPYTPAGVPEPEGDGLPASRGDTETVPETALPPKRKG